MKCACVQGLTPPWRVSQAQEVHADLRVWLSTAATADIAGAVRIIYGGSVKGSNCTELITLPDVDGELCPALVLLLLLLLLLLLCGLSALV